MSADLFSPSAGAPASGKRCNLEAAALVEQALRREEGVWLPSGALAVDTGAHTGRSAADKFIVRDPDHADSISWERNKGMSPEHFAVLRADMLASLQGGEHFTQDLFACAAPDYRLRVRVTTEFAWHSLFIRNLLRRPSAGELAGFAPDFTVVDLPGFRVDPDRHGCRSATVIAISFAERLALIGGTRYAGEMKKSVFTALNYLLPERGIMPMHCSANHAPSDPGDSAVFFGLSGTGKTTLSAAPDRVLIGDDEHGWGEGVLFNFEGGCYAKTYRLSEESEPEIYRAAGRMGSVLENVVLDPVTGNPDFMDGSRTENGRCAYPLEAISNASATGLAGEPRNVVMLACDSFGILPPISRLTPDQAVYHFLSGFTAKVAGTERGLTEPTPTFSACFGAPFLPRPPVAYGRLFRASIERQKPNCWLVNTGWSGGGVGVGERMPIRVTRGLIAAALSGTLAEAPVRRDPRFGFEVPLAVPGIDAELLDPRSRWSDAEGYDAMADRLAGMFRENFGAFEDEVEAGVRGAGPVSG